MSQLTPPNAQTQAVDDKKRFTPFWFNFFNQIDSIVDPVNAQIAAINGKLATTIDVGFTGTIATAPLTLGGTPGSMTFTKGVLTAHVNAT